MAGAPSHWGRPAHTDTPEMEGEHLEGKERVAAILRDGSLYAGDYVVIVLYFLAIMVAPLVTLLLTVFAGDRPAGCPLQQQGQCPGILPGIQVPGNMPAQEAVLGSGL